MTTEFVRSLRSLTVEAGAARRARDGARRDGARRCTPIYTTDEDGRLRGVLSLRELLAAPEGARVERHRVERSA